MPLLLKDRADLSSPLALLPSGPARSLGIRVDRSLYERVRSGIYAERTSFRALKPWQRYSVRVHAFATTHPDAALCLESAAVVHGLPRFGETADIHVHDPNRTRSRRSGDVYVHTSSAPRELIRIGGLLVTSMLDTVVDLVRVLTPAQALAVIDAALSPAQGGELTLERIRRRAAGRPSSRGAARERSVWDRADPRAESPGESISRAVIEWCGFETPDLQHTFHYEGQEDRVDFLFPSGAVIGESDGWGKYQLEDPEHAADLLAAEKRREDRLRRHRHPFARWDTADAWRVDPLWQALLAAGVPLVRPPQPLMLATLRDHRRERQLRA